MALENVKALIGTELGVGDWLEVTQERIDRFAEATGDHQWIHVDPERAAQGPFGTTIAHGYLTLSLIPSLGGGGLPVTGAKMGINYGLDRVRFIAPVKVGSRVRARRKLVDVTEGEGFLQLKVEVTVEIEGQDKPAAIAETLSRAYF
ncbi:MAG: MaoC family dehydratase [Actinomycetota bacterium]